MTVVDFFFRHVFDDFELLGWSDEEIVRCGEIATTATARNSHSILTPLLHMIVGCYYASENILDRPGGSGRPSWGIRGGPGGLLGGPGALRGGSGGRLGRVLGALGAILERPLRQSDFGSIF